MSFNKRFFLLTASIIATCYVLVLGEGPMEHFHVGLEELGPDVLKHTVGILTLNAGVKGGKEWQTYIRQGGKFVPDRILNLVAATKPVSHFGLSSVEGVENFRYPIVSRQDRFYCVVYDPIADSRAWVNFDELEKHFYCNEVEIETSSSPRLGLGSINIFCFTQSGRRKLYTQPDEQAAFSIVAKGEGHYSGLIGLEQTGNFLKVGRALANEDGETERMEELGWIKIRDEAGRLTFWLEMFDDC